MIKENFIPLSQATLHASNVLRVLSRKADGNEQDLDIEGVPATPAQEVALIASLDTSASLVAWNEAVRVFTSAVDENPWEPV